MMAAMLAAISRCGRRGGVPLFMVVSFVGGPQLGGMSLGEGLNEVLG